MKIDVQDILAVCALLLIGTAFWWIYPPLALIFAGLVFLKLALGPHGSDVKKTG